ncbi:hypothetical protein LCL97_13965 [Seohaeicola saemankumensis]|nr:hypothetical protein [Seohaeicola saemankumensis]MCA0871941.1 hypothetical protein [Seohaeicola saemankumensis]
MRIFPTLGLALTLTLQPAFADYGGSGSTGSTGEGASAGLSNATTRKVVRILKREFDRCQSVESIYRYDCYRQTYKLAGDQIAGNPAYAPALRALDGVETRLQTITRTNRDPAAPLKRKGFQTFTPIKPAAVPKSKVELRRALDEAETILLRSAADTGQVHFTKIAEAVNSNKVLLRSLLAPLRQLIHRFA